MFVPQWSACQLGSGQQSMECERKSISHINPLKLKQLQFRNNRYCNLTFCIRLSQMAQFSIPKGRFRKTLKRIKELSRDLVQSVSSKINPQRKEFCFELFGLDFMLDSELLPWLIQANSNPCLETGGTLLSQLIPNLVDNVFRIAIDPLFPPPYDISKTRMNARLDYFQRNKFDLVFDRNSQSDAINGCLSKPTEREALSPGPGQEFPKDTTATPSAD